MNKNAFQIGDSFTQLNYDSGSFQIKGHRLFIIKFNAPHIQGPTRIDTFDVDLQARVASMRQSGMNECKSKNNYDCNRETTKSNYLHNQWIASGAKAPLAICFVIEQISEIT